MANSQDFIINITEQYIEAMRKGRIFSLEDDDLTEAEKRKIEETYETDLFIRLLLASGNNNTTEATDRINRKPCSSGWTDDKVRNLISSTIQRMRRADDNA